MVKLMKYELRSSLRLFAPLWGGALAVSLLNLLTSNAGFEKVSGRAGEVLAVVMIVAFVLSAVALLILPAIYVVVRFYHSMVKDEAYLTFTLPVRVDGILCSKLLAGMLLQFGSLIVGLLMVLIWFGGLFSTEEIRLVLVEIIEQVNGVDLAMIGASFCLLLLLGTASSLLHYFLSMAIGQTSDRHKILLSVGAYFGINLVISTISNIAAVPFALDMFENPQWFALLGTSEAIGRIIWICMLFVCCLNVVTAGVFYLITRILFKNSLNLA